MLQTVDFHGAVEAARRKINAWVESETQGKTKQNYSHSIPAFLHGFNKWNSRVGKAKTCSHFCVFTLMLFKGSLSSHLLLKYESKLLARLFMS